MEIYEEQYETYMKTLAKVNETKAQDEIYIEEDVLENPPRSKLI